MPWGTWILAASVLVVAVSLAQENAEVSKTGLTEIEKTSESEVGEVGADVAPIEQQNEREVEVPRRTRIRPGTKRRRRMRKRPRTTASPLVDDQTELTGGGEQSTESFVERPHRPYDNEQLEGAPRRKTGKKRRRPLRRYPDREDYPEHRVHANPDGPRRRRKGGRKRPKGPEIGLPQEGQDTNSDNQVETTTLPAQVSEEPNLEEIHVEDTVAPEVSSEPEPSSSTTEETIHVLIEQVSPSSTTEESKSVETAVTVPVEHTTDDTVIHTAVEEAGPIQELTPQVLNAEEPILRLPTRNKIFDRRALFPSSRNLPPTSANIRRRLQPKGPTLNKPQSEPSESQKGNVIPKDEILGSSLLPRGYTTPLEIISPTQLIDESRSRLQEEHEEATEEPNYPKITTQPPQGNKVEETTTTTREPYMTTFGIKVNVTIEELREENRTREEEPSTYKTVPVKTDELKYAALDIPNVKDEILDLIKSESGTARLARILEIANMTLKELIQHRERGSSQLHLSEIFHRPKKAESPAPTTESDKQVEEAEPAPTKIAFPDEEVMGLFPTFVEKIENKEQELNDTREARVLEEENKTVEPYTWRVIPNPKLNPVPVQGHYEEIILTKYPSTGRPTYAQSANEVLLSEYDTPILHRNEIGHQLTAETIRTKTSGDYTSFRRIPPGMKSAIIVSGAILVMAIFGFLSVLISCRVRQRKARLRAKRDVLCERLQTEDFMISQRSLSPVLTKTREPVFTQGIHSNTTSNRHYYLWRTLRKTFQYD